jgi:spore coat polysaccharide biosynthesis predicted glycosyltransferase SpsG
MRPDFIDIAPRDIISDKINSIFITFGGKDRFGSAIDISAFILKEFPEINLYVVLGRAVPAAKMPKTDKEAKIVYQRGLSAADMIKLMQKCDIAISSGGQTLYELARTGTPTIGICAAENQLNNLTGWEKTGFLKYCGWYGEPFLFQNIKSAMVKLQDKTIRKKMSKTGQCFVDGKGAQRVTETMLGAIYENVKSR